MVAVPLTWFSANPPGISASTPLRFFACTTQTGSPGCTSDLLGVSVSPGPGTLDDIMSDEMTLSGKGIVAVTPDPLALTEGAAATITVRLSKAAPTGGIWLPISSTIAASSFSTPVSVNVAAGTTTATFTATALQDANTVSESGSMTVTDTTGKYYSDTVTVNLTDDDGVAIHVSPASRALTEGGAAANVTVWTDTAAPVGGRTVSVTNPDPGAVSAPASVVIAAGTTSTTLAVSPVSDADSADESLTLTLTAAGLTSAALAVTVTDDETPFITLAPSTLVLSEGLGGGAITLTLSEPSPVGGMTVTLTSADTGAVTVPASVFLAAGATTTTFTAEPVDDADSADELVTITASSMAWADGTADAAVLDDELPFLSFDLATLALAEGASGTAWLYLSEPAGAGGVVATLSPADATVFAAPVTAYFAPGATGVSLLIDALQDWDSADESSSLSASSGGWTASALTVTVTDDESAFVQAGATSVALTEGGGSQSFTIYLSEPAPVGGTTVTLTSADTGAVTAPTSVFIAAGATTATVTVFPVDDADALDESVSITVNAGAYGSTSVTTTVTDDDTPTLTLPAGPIALTEGAGAVNVTLTLNQPAPVGGLTVSLASSDATSATVPATVFFAAGDTQATFAVTPVDDWDSVNESLTVTASAAGWTGDNVAVTVTDDESAFVQAGATSVALTEGGGSQSFTIYLSEPVPVGGTTVTLTSADTGAVTAPTSVFIAAGTTTATVTVYPVDDADALDESVSITVNAGAYGTASVTATVNDDDSPTLSLPAGPVALIEGAGAVNVTLTLNQPAPVGGLTVNLASSDATAATVAATVFFAAGATQATFAVTPVNDWDSVNESLSVTASAAGWTGDSVAVTVADDETPFVQTSVGTVALAEGGVTQPVIIYLSAPAPLGGTTATITTADAGAVTATRRSALRPVRRRPRFGFIRSTTPTAPTSRSCSRLTWAATARRM